MGTLLSVAEAAKRLTAAGDKIDRSGLSYYLKRHAEALPTVKASGRLTLVDYDAVVAHRRALLGKGGEGVPVARPGGLSLAEERRAKLRADRLLGLDRLKARLADLVPFAIVDGLALAAELTMRDALALAASATGQAVAAEHEVNPAPIESLFRGHGIKAHASMVASLRKAGFLSMSAEERRAAAAERAAADDAEPPEPTTLAEERAAKIRVDRRARQLDRAELHRVVIPTQEGVFAFTEAVVVVRQTLASEARDAGDALAKLAGVEPPFIRSAFRHHERRALDLFVKGLAEAREEARCQPNP